MRPSNRAKILDAAVRVTERDGVTALTYESVAAEASLTKGGLLYHFPSREALLEALHEHLAGAWEASLVEAGGGTSDDLDVDQRLAAYARISVTSATRAELLLMLEAAGVPQQQAVWDDVLDRWTPPVPSDDPSPAELDRMIAWLAADGLWLHGAINNKPLPRALRERIARHLAESITTGPRLSPD